MNLNRRNLFVGLSALFGAAVLPKITSATALENKTPTVIPTVVSDYEKVKQQVIDATNKFVEDMRFEFNDEITRNLYVKTIDPILHAAIQNKILLDYCIVCDQTNNTPALIEQNRFASAVYLKKVRYSVFECLSFKTARTGMTMEEVNGWIF